MLGGPPHVSRSSSGLRHHPLANRHPRATWAGPPLAGWAPAASVGPEPALRGSSRQCAVSARALAEIGRNRPDVGRVCIGSDSARTYRLPGVDRPRPARNRPSLARFHDLAPPAGVAPPRGDAVGGPLPPLRRLGLVGVAAWWRMLAICPCRPILFHPGEVALARTGVTHAFCERLGLVAIALVRLSANAWPSSRRMAGRADASLLGFRGMGGDDLRHQIGSLRAQAFTAARRRRLVPSCSIKAIC